MGEKATHCCKPGIRSVAVLRYFGLVVSAAVLTLCLWILYKELKAFHYADLVLAFQSLRPLRILAALGLTALNYFVLTGYDLLALRYVNHPLPYRQVAFVSFSSYAVSNTLGMPLLTGAPLRFRLYTRWGLPALDTAKLVVFSGITLWLGFLTLAGLVYTVNRFAFPALRHLPVGTLRPMGGAFLLLVCAYLAVSAGSRGKLRIRGLELSAPPPFLACLQILLSVTDWLLVSLIAYILLPPGIVSFPVFLGAFLLAQMAGLISYVPGGIGVLEAVLVLLLTPPLGVPQLLGALLVFRMVYYVLPLTLAVGALVLYEVRGLEVKRGLAAPTEQFVASLAPPVMAGLVFLAGAILLISGATPAVGSRLGWLDRVLPLTVTELSHFLASMVGVALLLLARALQLRLKAGLYLALAMLAGGIVFSLLKAFDYEEALILSAVAAALWASRRQFYRPAALFSERFTPEWTVAVLAACAGSVLVGFFAFRHVEYADSLWWRFRPQADVSRSMRAAVGGGVLLAAFGAARLLSTAKVAPRPPDHAELERAAPIAAASPRADANLVFLGDKKLLFDKADRGFLMYGIQGRSWIAMGDPVGPAEVQRELAWEFYELCERRAAWPVFYEVGPATLPFYLDMGLSLLKLGEEAHVSLPEFSVEGSGRKEMRHAWRKVSHSGARFEVVPRETVPDLMPILRTISNDWLARKRTAEKMFSLGRFDETYLGRFPAAVVRLEHNIVAFANVWSGAPGAELSVDLMRYAERAPRGVMEYLFVELMLWGRERQYQTFNLGMSPLSGIESREYAPLRNKLSGALFRHGEHFYGFQGLRHFKSQFDPVWEPRYLASPGGFVLPRALINVSTLVAGTLKGVVAR